MHLGSKSINLDCYQEDRMYSLLSNLLKPVAQQGWWSWQLGCKEKEELGELLGLCCALHLSPLTALLRAEA